MNILDRYYDAFNRADMDTFLALLSDEVVHDINQGPTEVGRHRFARFMQRMNEHYREQIVDIVTFVSTDGTRGAAEFIVEGTYLKTDAGLPEAAGQTYRLRAGAFFEIRGDQIARVTNYYNLQEWMDQVSR